MHNTLPGCTVPEKAKNHIFSTQVLFCKCKPGPCTNLCAYNPMTTIKSNIFSKKMHATTFTFSTTGCLAIQFRHTTVNRYTFCYCQSMVPVSCDKNIFRSCGSHTSCGNGFLPDISMKKATDLPLHFVFFFSCQFKLADKLHQFIPIQVGLFGKPGGHRF